MNQLANDQNQEENKTAILQIIVAEWRFIAAITLTSLAIATALAFFITKRYEAVVLLSYAENTSSKSGLSKLGGLAEIAGIGSMGNEKNEANLAYLTSRSLIENFIREQNLLPVLYPKKWDSEKKAWKVPDEDIPSYWKAYKLFSKKILKVTSDKKTQIITLTILWKDRLQAVEWANEFVRMANNDLRTRTIQETALSLEYLQKELQKTSIVDIQSSIYKVMESQIKTMMMANTQEQYAFKVIDPALPVDADAYASPKRLIIIVAGIIIGFIFGSAVSIFKNSRKNDN